jgi:hypothetical protein
VLGDAAGVGVDALEDAGAAGRQPGVADDVEAGQRGEATTVRHRSVTREERGVEPVEVGSESGGPDDRADAFGAGVEGKRGAACVDYGISGRFRKRRTWGQRR